MLNNSNNFDSSMILQKSLARVDYKKHSTMNGPTGVNSRVSSSSKSSSLAFSEHEKHLANMEAARQKPLTNQSTKPPLHHGLNYQNQNILQNKPLNLFNNKNYVDDHYNGNGSDMDTMRQLEPSSFSRTHKYGDFDENKYSENKSTRTNFDENSRTSFNNNNNNYNNNSNGVGSEVAVPSSKVNKNYLDKMKRKFKRKISANVSGTKFDIVKEVIDAIGCRIASDDNFDCNLIWDDTRVSVEGVSELRSFQRFNHFPAMSEISKKDALARNILKICKVLPQDFDFVPKTWIMPTDYSNLLSYSIEMKKMQQKRTYIMKPANGAMGHGIKLYRNVERIQPTDNFIVQEYIGNPYLLDGFKFDMRIYVLVTSCDPLRAFIYNNGLVRLGTEKYQEPHESNIDHLFMHLTNYSVNKRNKQFYDEGDSNGETGTKRSLKYLFDHLRRNNIDGSKVWKNIQDIMLKTILVAEPYLFHTYKMCRPGQIPGTESVCFEILGFDILLDDKMKPWVLEVNRSPSFGALQQIDFDIKSKLLVESFELLHLRVSDRQRSHDIEKAEAKRRLYNINRSDLGNMSNHEANLQKSLITTANSLMSGNNGSYMKKFKSKEKRKLELIDQIKLMRREQRRQEYENRNLGNFSRLFPIDNRHDMDFYLNILSTAFNLFYPVGKHVLWRKTYERIKEDELLNELVECDDDIIDQPEHDQNKKINEYLRDDYMSTDSEEAKSDSSDEDHDYRKDPNKSHLNTTSHHHHHHDHLNHSHLSSRLYESDNPDDLFNRERDNESKISTQRSKVSKNTLMNNEHLKASRLSTLVGAVSTNNLLASTSNFAANDKYSNKKTKSKDTDEKTIDIMSVKNNTNNETNNTNNTNNNTEQTNALNLLKQIKHHQAMAASNTHLTSRRSNNSASNNNINNTKSSSMSFSNKEALEGSEEMSENNLSKLTIAVLKLLNQLEIKFPGKNNDQTKVLINSIYSKLETYKPKLANYWMIKLDDSKRAKILNIVKSNLIVILQKVYMVSTVENLRLFKIFTKLLNRMLWMHGQGLWNCFTSTTNNTSWESIFSKSSFTVSENELKCCYRIIELCKDCVIIVYQYAFEQKPNNEQHSNNSNTNTPTDLTNRLGNTSSLNRFKNISSSTSNLTLLKSRYK